MPMKRNSRGRTAILLLLAAISFTAMASNGRLDRVRAVDALNLFAIGVLVGSAFTGVLIERRLKKLS